MARNTGWVDNVEDVFKSTYFCILQELTQQRNATKNDLYMIVGDTSLLLQDYLDYRSLWDIDLMFKDENAVNSFLNYFKDKAERTEHDGKVLVFPTFRVALPIQTDRGEKMVLSSMKWSTLLSKGWMNMDLIMRKEFGFDFYWETIKDQPSFSSKFNWNKNNYDIDLRIAHPWDTLIHKVFYKRMDVLFEPGTEYQPEGFDLKHIYYILKHDGADPKLWAHVKKRTPNLKLFCERLEVILNKKKELGYIDIEIPIEDIRKNLDRLKQ